MYVHTYKISMLGAHYYLCIFVILSGVDKKMKAALRLTVNVTNKHVAGTCTTTDCILVYDIVIFIVIMLFISKIKKKSIENKHFFTHWP